MLVYQWGQSCRVKYLALRESFHITFLSLLLQVIFNQILWKELALGEHYVSAQSDLSSSLVSFEMKPVDAL